jgi:hypothetical protein
MTPASAQSSPLDKIPNSAQMPEAPAEPSTWAMSMTAELITSGPQPHTSTKLANANNSRSDVPIQDGSTSGINRQTLTPIPIAIKNGETTINRKNTNPGSPSSELQRTMELATRITMQTNANVVAAIRLELARLITSAYVFGRLASTLLWLESNNRKNPQTNRETGIAVAKSP